MALLEGDLCSGKYTDIYSHAVCQCWKWVNKDASILFGTFGTTINETYNIGVVQSILEYYHAGVIAKIIPEFSTDNTDIIVKFLLDNIKSESEPRIRAVLYELATSTFNPNTDTDRERIDPCVLLPLTHNCSVDAFNAYLEAKKAAAPSTITGTINSVTDLIQTLAIGAVVVFGISISYKLMRVF